MAASNTTSLSFPKMFDVVQNRVGVLQDNHSVTNRVRLLLLTSPTEMYNSPRVGTRLRNYTSQYITDNTKAALKDEIVSKIEEFEPCAQKGETAVIFNRRIDSEIDPDPDHLQMVVSVKTTFGGVSEVVENV